MSNPASPYVFNVDETDYLRRYPDVATAGMSAIEHFTLYGRAEGRNPNALFDRAYYLTANPDVASAGIDPFEHFLAYGLQEGRSPTALFDAAFYLAQNPDVRAAAEAGAITAAEHFFRYGQAEGRAPNAALDLSAYLAANADVRAAVEAGDTDALTHLLTFGFAEGRDLGNGVHLAAFAADSTFGNAVAAQDGTAALARVVAVAPFLSSFEAPAGWQPAPDTPIPTDFTPVDGPTLRVPEGIEVPEGVILPRDAFLPYLTLSVEGGVLRFGGNAEGEITLDLVDGVPTFTREGATAVVTDPAAVTGIVLDGATLSAPAEALDGRTATGSGALLLSGLQPETDLSGLAENLDVTVVVSQDLDITGSTALGAVDTFRIEEGASLTLSAAQAGATALEGAYIVQDSAAAFFDGAVPQPFVAEAAGLVITGTATLAQLTTLRAAFDGALSYDSLSGDRASLLADMASQGGAGTFVLPGKAVLVIDAASLAELDAIDAANGLAGVSVTAVADTALNLMNDGVPVARISEGVAVTVTDAATITQLVALDTRNGDGTLECALITDSWQALLSADAVAYLPQATTITLTSYDLGAVTVSDVQRLLAISTLVDGSGNPIALADLTYTLNDLPANLAQGDAEEIVVHASSVTASAPATVAQAMVIYDRDAAATYAITDSAWALAQSDSAADLAIRQAGDLVATTAATAEQAAVLYDRDGAGSVLYDISDHFQALNGLAAGVRNTARDITVSGDYYGSALSTANASAVVSWGNTGATTIHNIQGTAAEIGAFVRVNQETSGETALRYDFSVWDSVSGVLAEISAHDAAFAFGNAAANLTDDNFASSITVSGAFTVPQAQTFWDAVNPAFTDAATTMQRTYYGISSTVAGYTNEAVATLGIPGADSLHVFDTAANVHAAQNGLDMDHASIFSLIASRTNGVDYLTVTGSAGSQVIMGASGGDTIFGGTGADYINGGAGKDTLFAGDVAANTVWNSALYNGQTTIIGGRDGDAMFGSTDFDAFVYQGADRSQLIAESGTTQWSRDYITNFSLGDRILFYGASSVQFLSNGLASANTVDADSLGLAIRYEKNVQVLNYAGNDVIEATRVLIDVSDSSGHFDNVADMHIILVGSNIDVNWDGGALIFGG